MAHSANDKTQSLVGDIKSAMHSFHGAGETIRGSSMQALDGVFHKSEGEAKNKAIAEKGLQEMEPGRQRWHEVEQSHEAHAGGQSAGVGHGIGHHGGGPNVHGAGSHFAKERADENEVRVREGNESAALRAARMANEGHH